MRALLPEGVFNVPALPITCAPNKFECEKFMNEINS